jgi:hypothetical protein
LLAPNYLLMSWIRVFVIRGVTTPTHTTKDSNIDEKLGYNLKKQKPEKSSDKSEKSVGLLFFIKNLNL